ncbi:MAG: flippase-like domain-containing protein, partial [Bdellovibrionales bacterium]|nr:flippase-like domain-containing protein [Bdellovibrionales bacterium]
LGPLWVVGAIALAPLALAGWLLGPKTLTKLFPPGHRFGNAATQVARAFPHAPRPLLTATAISAAFHCLQIGMHWIIAQELDLPLTLAYLFATVPLVNIAASLPISMNGLGIREAGYLFLFVPVGVEPASAIAFGALWILAVTVVSALAGFVAASTFGSVSLSGFDQSPTTAPGEPPPSRSAV